MTGNEEILARLTAASAEGLAPNLRRFLAFLGWTEGEVFELQALHVPPDRNAGRWKHILGMAAHGSTLAMLERLAAQADAFKAQGVYAIFNRIKPAVKHRRGPDAWHEVPEGKGTKDNDITHRRALYIDLDPEREDGVKDISATGAELQAAAARAARARDILTRYIPDKAIAEGLSGNGCALFVALEPTRPEGEIEFVCKAALVALAGLLDDSAVKVDTGVSDPKRLCFLPGTVKRKGAHSAERPHRRAAFLAPEQPHRLTLAELQALVMSLRELLPEAARADLDKELAGPPSKGAPRGQASPSASATSRREAPQPSAPGGQACEQVNRELPVRDVLARFGLLDGDQPTCPGCRESDSGVAIVGNGLKCSHNRCAQKGYRAGFRTVVDLVVEVEGVDVPGALSYIRREFPGILPERPPAPQSAPAAAPPTEPPPVEQPPPAPPFLPLATPRDLPAFPLHALPRPVATFVSQIAAALECPLDLPACLALGALGSVSMKRFAASPKPDWQEPLNLYVAIALDPGESKSPAFRQVFGPLYALQKQQGEDWKEECKRIDERNADKAKGAPDEPKPARPRLFVDDATPEKIGMVMAEQGERITLASDEGTAFQHMCGLYSKNGQANAAIYLKAHDGGYYVVDRTVRESIHLEAPLMTVALAVQPTVIRELSKRPDLRGRGLWGRFIYAFPASRVGTRTHDGPPVDPLVRDEWRDLLTRLASPPLPSAPEVLRFSPEARRRFHQAELEIERALLPGGALSSVRDWAGKLRGLIARLAGLLHIAEEAAPGRELIPVATVEQAIDLARYFTAHALYTFNIEMTLDPAEQAARQAWEVIAQRGLERVTPGAIGKWVKSLRKTPDAVAALETLCRQGCLMTDPEHRGKGKAYLVRKGPTVPTNTDQYRPNTDPIPTNKDAENEQTDPQDLSRARTHEASPPPPPPLHTDPVGMVGMVGIDEKPAESERSAVGAGSVCGSVCSSDPANLSPEPTPPPASRVDTAPTANDREPPEASADDPPSYSVGPDGLGVIEA